MINRGNISIWFDPTTQWYAQPQGKHGRNQTYSDAALLDQIPLDEWIDSVYTDGAYDTKYCRKVISDRQAYAVIPPRKNAKLWKDKKMISLARNELLKTVKCLGRTIWKKWSGYHR